MMARGFISHELGRNLEQIHADTLYNKVLQDEGEFCVGYKVAFKLACACIYLCTKNRLTRSNYSQFSSL